MPEFNLKFVARSFNRVASFYDQAAVLPREVGSYLLQRLKLIISQPKVILDLGSGTGSCARRLEKYYNQAEIINLDISEGMLKKAKTKAKNFNRQHFTCADTHNLPFLSQSIDIIFSNLTLYWANDVLAVLREWQRVLKPNGILMFSTFGPDTLQELRYSWQTVDQDIHVNPFIDMHDLGDLLLQAEFIEPVMDVEQFCLTYENVPDLIHDLKTLGERNLNSSRFNGLTGKRKFQEMIEAYERYRTEDSRLPANYEVIYGHAWGTPAVNSSSTGQDILIPVSSIKRRG